MSRCRVAFNRGHRLAAAICPHGLGMLKAKALLLLSVLEVLQWQLHADSPRGQFDSLLLLHIHSWVVSLQERRIHSLRLDVLQVLLGLNHSGLLVGLNSFTDAELDWRGAETTRWQLAQERAVEGDELVASDSCRHLGGANKGAIERYSIRSEDKKQQGEFSKLKR